MDKYDYNQEIVARIIAARNKLGLKQKEVAQLTNYSTKNISKIEKGETNINFSHLEKFSHILKEDILYFLPRTYIKSDENIIDKFGREVSLLNKDFQEVVFNLIDDLRKVQDNYLDSILVSLNKDNKNSPN